MKRKLVIVTTDMEIELAMFVDGTKLTKVRNVVEKAREKYYEEECYSKSESFEAVLSNMLNESCIDFEIIGYEEM